MKFKLFLFVFFFLGYMLKAQIPLYYYLPAEGLGGVALKAALYNIIKGHRQYEYTSDTTDVWDILKQTDKDPNNPDNVIEIYSGWSVNAAQEYNNGSGWDREHVWAKVHGGFGTNPGAGTDAHHLRPIDGSVNSARNSRWFANCTTPYSVNGIATGSFTSSTQYVWEPRDEDKGDVARMIFYIAVRYEGENGEPNLEIVDSIPSNNNDPSPIMAKLSDLLQWNLEDTIDERERNRNDIIYYNFQHNRNPFIDHPEYALRIWGIDSLSANVLSLSKNNAISVYPNPSTDYLHVVSVYHFKDLSYSISDVFGKKLLLGKLSEEHAVIDIKKLPKGMYFLSLGTDAKNNVKLIKD